MQRNTVGKLRGNIICTEWHIESDCLNSSSLTLESENIFMTKMWLSLSLDCKAPFLRQIYLNYCGYGEELKNEPRFKSCSCYVDFSGCGKFSETIVEHLPILSIYDSCSSAMCIGRFSLMCLLNSCGKIPNGTLKISFKIYYNDADNKEKIYFTPGSESTLAQQLEKLFLSEREADILIKVKGILFKSHRYILAARSEVFAAMLQQDMVENRSGEIEINDCNPGCFKNFLLYLYTDKSNLVTAENVFDLYYIAHKYSIEQLKNCCLRFFFEHFCSDSICDVLVLSTTYDELKLLEAATDFFCENAEEIVQTAQWDEFQMTNKALSKVLLLKSFRKLKIK